MPVQTVRDILVADSTVTDLVGLRIAPLVSDQDETLPCVTLQCISVAPQNHLNGVPTLDANIVQLDAWATTYAEARAVADACRNALQAAGLKMESDIDGYEFDPDEFRVTQEFYVWT